MNYLSSRSQAGILLANELDKLKNQLVAVVALSEGGVLVGAEIARRLHTSLFILATQHAEKNNENAMTALSANGVFSYNTFNSLGELEEDAFASKLLSSTRSMIEYQKLNSVAGKDGFIPKALLKRHTVILVSDGLKTALSLQVAVNFMRDIEIKRLIIATPIASLEAVDRMHMLVDQIFCLRVAENYISTEHYYDNNNIPDDKTVVEIMKNIVLNWQATGAK